MKISRSVSRDLKRTAKISTKPMPCGKKTVIESLRETQKKG